MSVWGHDQAARLQVAAGLAHTAVLDTQGALYTLGWGLHGQLGLADTGSRDRPTLVGGQLEQEDAVQACPCLLTQRATG